MLGGMLFFGVLQFVRGKVGGMGGAGRFGPSASSSRHAKSLLRAHGSSGVTGGARSMPGRPGLFPGVPQPPQMY
jgi:hypothetical protein